MHCLRSLTVPGRRLGRGSVGRGGLATLGIREVGSLLGLRVVRGVGSLRARCRGVVLAGGAALGLGRLGRLGLLHLLRSQLLRSHLLHVSTSSHRLLPILRLHARLRLHVLHPLLSLRGVPLRLRPLRPTSSAVRGCTRVEASRGSVPTRLRRNSARRRTGSRSARVLSCKGALLKLLELPPRQGLGILGMPSARELLLVEASLVLALLQLSVLPLLLLEQLLLPFPLLGRLRLAILRLLLSVPGLDQVVVLPFKVLQQVTLRERSRLLHLTAPRDENVGGNVLSSGLVGVRLHLHFDAADDGLVPEEEDGLAHAGVLQRDHGAAHGAVFLHRHVVAHLLDGLTARVVGAV
mmetsp:Transcript_32806/g.97440  ORF Transcript_32806/g.97440 Transcript_32806/m.97440 type:complete len:351 (+) Transcript_32806:139-1191(+)